MPRFKTGEPVIPASADVLKPGSRAQHSSVERLWCALSTVTFSVEPRDASRASDAVVRRAWARIDRRILGMREELMCSERGFRKKGKEIKEEDKRES